MSQYVDNNSLLTQHEIWLLCSVNHRRQVTDILRLDMEPAEANEEPAERIGTTTVTGRK